MKSIIFIACLFFISILCSSCTSIPAPTQQPNIIDDGKPLLTQSQKTKWAHLTGKWFGSELTKTGGKTMWLAERRNDGTYKIQFRIIDIAGKKRERIEVGAWGVSGDIFFTIYKGNLEGDKFVPVDFSDPYNCDAYKILKLTNETFEYISADSGEKYTAKKVPADFKFPE